jgi:hypothetical protein
MSLFGSIGSFLGGPIGGFAGDLIGGAISGGGGTSAANDLKREQYRLADEATKEGRARDVSGILGGVTFDPETGSPTQTLSPEMQEYFDKMNARTSRLGNQIDEYGTGEEAADRFYNQQRSLFGQKDMTDKLRMENRLRAQGGSTTADAQKMGNFAYQQMMADQGRQVNAWDQSQDYLDKLYGRETDAFGQAVKAGSVGDKYTKLGMDLGDMYGDNAWKSANFKLSGAETKAGADAGFWKGIGSSVGDADFNGMFGGGNSYDYTEDYGSAAGTAGNPGFGPNTMYSGAGNWTYV